MDSGKVFAATWDALRHIEYGYTTTSHSSQGMTVDRVLVQIDIDRSAQLVNRQQFYVSISRARVDVQVFTNSVERLPAVVAREVVKTTAREAVQGQQRDHHRAQTRGQERGPKQERGAQTGQQMEWRTERNRPVTLEQKQSRPQWRQNGQNQQQVRSGRVEGGIEWQR